MSRFKDFDAAEAERKREPITFRLGGREWTVAHANAGTFLAFTRKVAEGGNSVILGFEDYITACLTEEDRAAFREMLPECDVSLSVLSDLGTWIVEQATGSPFADASSSPAEQSRVGRSVRVVSLDPVSETGEDSASATG